MTHLGDGGGYVAAKHADPGASSGDQSTCTSRCADSRDRTPAWGSRNTVKRYLSDATAVRYARRLPRPTKLDPFKAYVLERIDAARPHWIPAAVLHRELRERGYAGGVTQLKMMIAPYKRSDQDPVVRFETAPGQQMQADFKHVRRGRQALMAFVATLGYSRASYVRFTTDETAATLCSCIRDALLYFGGVPAHVLFDNASTIVVERDAYGDGRHRWRPLVAGPGR